MTKSRFLLLATLFVAAVSVRIIPYILGWFELTDVKRFAGFLWNFSPITALFLFCGAQFSEKRWAYGVPLAAMLLSDVAIGLLLGDMAQGLHPAIPAIYGSYALIVFSGTLLRKLERQVSKNDLPVESRSLSQRIAIELLYLLAVAGAGLTGEIVFFVVTNFATWTVQTEYYPQTWDGLVACYVAAIPFFKNAVESTPLYAIALFGGCALAESWFPALRERPAEAARAEQVALA